MFNYERDLNREIMRERRAAKKSTGELSCKAWNFNNAGSAYCRESSFAEIFAAYHDKRISEQW